MPVTSIANGTATTIRRWLRLVFALYTFGAALVTGYVWNRTGTATDWGLFYRIAFPIATGTLLVGALWPRIGHTALLMLPLAIAAIVRIIDFWQDYYVTPRPDLYVDGTLARIGEPVDIIDRMLGTVGWLFIATSVVHIVILEVLIIRRLDEGCLNAPDCPWRSPPRL